MNDTPDDVIDEFFEERAAIREMCGGMDILQAEYHAVRDCRKYYGRVPQSVLDRVMEKRKQSQTSFLG